VAMGADDKSQQVKAIIQFQKFKELLSNERSPPAEKVIEKFIQCGVVPQFVKYLAMDDIPQIQVCFNFSKFM
ncbi:importin subunit alpha-1-like, partial [Trifolium medium]|nr:importin subunit alpha-1-like [Trifolium medium]